MDSAMPSLHPSPWEAGVLAGLMVGLKAELKEAVVAAAAVAVAVVVGVVVGDLELKSFQSLVNAHHYHSRSHSPDVSARSDYPASPSAQCR